MFFLRLIRAAPDSEDTVNLLKSAAKAHIPIDPAAKKALLAGEDMKPHPAVPGSHSRPSIPDVVQELQEQSWYKDQIVHSRVFESRSGIPGEHGDVYGRSKLQTIISRTIGFTTFTNDSTGAEGIEKH